MQGSNHTTTESDSSDKKTLEDASALKYLIDTQGSI